MEWFQFLWEICILGSGKSNLCQQILSAKLFDKPASQVILCLPKNSSHLLKETIQEYREVCKGILIHEGIPNTDSLDLRSNGQHQILIFDDLALRYGNSGYESIWFCTQN